MLSYQPELDLFCSLLRQFNLKVHILPLNSTALMREEPGPRGVFSVDNFEKIEKKLKDNLRANTVYHITDEFTCRYALLSLPEHEEQTILVVGPYVNTEIDISWVERFVEERGIHVQWIPILETYYRGIPCLKNEKVLSAAINSLGERIWGLHRFGSEEIVSGLPESCLPLTSAPEAHIQEDITNSIKMTEYRYEAENRFMQMVSQGRSHRALVMISNFSRGAIENRTEPIRNIKNYSIILNTLMRKAAEQGGVHPMYIDRLSSEFARKIETTALFDDFMELWQDMTRRYCLLVKNHATKSYSQLVQHIIARVDYDLTADLSLKANAAALNVNASYLSTLFKKETGSTLTDYVNRKRMEHAIFLLNTSDLPISVVGQRCGVQDDNYFTKIFKKYTGTTPKQFRQENSRLHSIK